MKIRAVYVFLGLALVGGRMEAQAAPAKQKCTVDHTPLTDADRALQARRYDEAQTLYAAMLAADPKSGAAMAGEVRSELRAGKIPEALALAQKFAAAAPGDSKVLDALGEVRFRRGEVDEAAITFNKALSLNLCDGVTYYDMARFLDLKGLHATAQQRLESAHSLAPDNPEITRTWRQSHAVPPTPEERLANLKARLNDASLTEDQKAAITAAIKGIESREKGDCQLVEPIEQVKLPILALGGPVPVPGAMRAAGLEVSFNGKKRRMEIDTGASGLLLSASVAKAAGLVPEFRSKAGGIGDSAAAGAYVTHVDSIKIGPMEFRNCMVNVLEHGNVLDIDGLIGPDVFRDYVVTLDFPQQQVRLSPLPKRPDEQVTKSASLDTGDEDAKPLSAADRARDRYIAPEMKDWTEVFRVQHFLIFPTVIGNTPVKLFMMDTGAGSGMITPAAAREVTHVEGDSGMIVHGLSGEVKNVMAADDVTITFARVRQELRGLQSFDNALLSRLAGVEVSGIIGFPTLRELVISIDYRDNLVKVVYDPSKGFHMR